MESFNINDNVWVELNDYGWQCIRDYFVNLFSLVPETDIDQHVALYKNRTKTYVENGEKINLTKFQMHELMHMLGSKCYVGANNVIKNNRIRLSVDGLEELTANTEETKHEPEDLTKKTDELKIYLQREWKYNVHKRYQKYFDLWYENITNEQIIFFNAWMRGNLSPFVLKNK